jgi:hypothetical protein
MGAEPPGLRIVNLARITPRTPVSAFTYSNKRCGPLRGAGAPRVHGPAQRGGCAFPLGRDPVVDRRSPGVDRICVDFAAAFPTEI